MALCKSVLCNELLEREFLSALLADNHLFEDVAPFLCVRDFSSPICGYIFDACARLIDSGRIADTVSVRDALAKEECGSDADFENVLDELVLKTVDAANGVGKAQRIAELSVRRKLVAICETIGSRAMEPDGSNSATELLEETEEALYRIAESTDFGNGFVPFSRTLASVVEATQPSGEGTVSNVGVATTCADIDGKLGGLWPSDLVLLVAEKDLGGLELTAEIAFNVALAHLRSSRTEGGHVGLFTCGTSVEQMACRFLSKQADIPLSALRRCGLANSDMHRLKACGDALSDLPLFVEETANPSIWSIRTQARRLKRQYGLDLIVISDLSTVRRRSEITDWRINDPRIVRDLKTLAEELCTPIIVATGHDAPILRRSADIVMALSGSPEEVRVVENPRGYIGEVTIAFPQR